MVAVAIVGAAVVGAGASVAASSSASHTARDNAAANNALQENIYGQNQGNLQPYINTGNKATASIESLLGLNPDQGAAEKAFSNYQGSTEYQSRLKQGADSVTSGLGARGLLDSGAAQKSLLKYGQTFASNEFGQYLGNLQTQQGTGLTAASALAGVGQNYANAVTNNNNNAANTSENASLSNASAINGILGNAVSAYSLSQGLGSSYKSPSQGYSPQYPNGGHLGTIY
jgi:hypothetical protein